MNLDIFINGIEDINKEIKIKAEERVDNLAKPPKSLGELENIAVKIAAITGRVKNNINKKAVIIFSADNGVVEEGVASTPQIVTLTQTINFTKGKTGVAVFAKATGTDMKVYDLGINSDIIIENVKNKKIAKGTKNIAKGPAMTRKQCIEAIEIGIEAVKECKDENYDLIGLGEMGIGNTSTSSAVLMALTGVSADEAVGFGAGLTIEAFNHKKEVIKRALEINKIDNSDIIDILAKLGGFDIAAMVGAYIGAAYYKIPIVIDGFITVVAALAAIRLNGKIKDYIFPSHCSRENGYNIAIEELGLTAILNLNMALGEGSGAVIAFGIIESALAMMNNMATFKEAEINSSYLDILRN
ncbi:MAG: nicotinate-nucleotide--dimethylbenzimidazole phosphoribosyltransferase [Sarcina sp.]